MLRDYDFVDRGDAGLFHAAADPGAAGRRLRAGLRAADARTPARAGGGAGRAALQVRRALGPARRAASRLCRRPACRRRAPSCRTTCAPGAASPSPRPSRRRVPRLAPRHAPARGHGARRWVVLAPERVFVPDEIALEILQLLDGARSVDAIVDEPRRRRYDARRATRSPRDVAGACWQDLAEKRGVVAAVTAPPPPLGLLAELTHRCPLRCPYCSNPLELDRACGELDAADLVPRVRRGRGAGRAAGPPVGRRADAAARPAGADRGARGGGGLYTNLITAGVLLDARAARGPGRGRARPRPALACRTPSRRSADRIGGLPRRARAQAGLRRGWCARRGCRSRSTPSCTGRTSTSCRR